jgi:hypothetical protein
MMVALCNPSYRQDLFQVIVAASLSSVHLELDGAPTRSISEFEQCRLSQWTGKD